MESIEGNLQVLLREIHGLLVNTQNLLRLSSFHGYPPMYEAEQVALLSFQEDIACVRRIWEAITPIVIGNKGWKWSYIDGRIECNWKTNSASFEVKRVGMTAVIEIHTFASSYLALLPSLMPVDSGNLNIHFSSLDTTMTGSTANPQLIQAVQSREQMPIAEILINHFRLFFSALCQSLLLTGFEE